MLSLPCGVHACGLGRAGLVSGVREGRRHAACVGEGMIRCLLALALVACTTDPTPRDASAEDAFPSDVNDDVPRGAGDSGEDAPRPVGGPALSSLAAGEGTTCAVLDDGSARCWGDNRAGQLGDGTRTSSVRPVAVAGLNDATAISAGYEFACALRALGTVVCWGSGTNGRLGHGSTEGSPTPVEVAGLSGVTAIHAGYSTACALRDDGTVWCWGRGGELGRTMLSDSSVPVAVPGLSDVRAIGVASHGGTTLSSHTCGVRTDGTAFCWGLNDDGQNGTGNQEITRTPAAVVGLTGVTAIAAGMTHACAVSRDGVSCWGTARHLGDGTVERRFVPGPVDGALDLVALTAGFGHTCGRTPAGDVWCWGDAGSGQVGDGEPIAVGGVRLSPVRADVRDVVLLAAGASHTCAHDAAHVTTCWGSNVHGEAGSGEPGATARTSVPSVVVW